jgi:hypothetical protein
MWDILVNRWVTDGLLTVIRQELRFAGASMMLRQSEVIPATSVSLGLPALNLCLFSSGLRGGG